MSKVDALRAMREARYAANQTRRPPAAASSAPPAAVPGPAAVGAPAKKAPGRRAAKAAAPGPEPTEEGAAPEAALCGHRNIGGKTCRRPAAHPEKNHRYG